MNFILNIWFNVENQFISLETFSCSVMAEAVKILLKNKNNVNETRNYVI